MILQHTEENLAEFQAFTERFALTVIETVLSDSDFCEAAGAACHNEQQYSAYCLWLAVKAGL